MTQTTRQVRALHLDNRRIVRNVTFGDLHSLWKAGDAGLEWACLFTLPIWLKCWWDVFDHGDARRLLLIEDPRGIIGFAPMQGHGTTATFIGSPNVCDYLDVVPDSAHSSEFAEALFEYFGKEGIQELDLYGVREDAVVWTHLVPYARASGWEVTCEKEGVSFDIELPPSWEAFHSQLNGKQRHELRRKLRRLQEAGDIQFRIIEAPDQVPDAFQTFIELFKAGPAHKAAFMTDAMIRFFRSLAVAFAEQNILKLGLLDIDGSTVSAVMCFDYRSTRYLYNSGYAPNYQSLSVGLLCKAFSIRDAIESGLSRYDFLKGEEAYKQRLGGKPRRIHRCNFRV